MRKRSAGYKRVISRIHDIRDKSYASKTWRQVIVGNGRSCKAKGGDAGNLDIRHGDKKNLKDPEM